MIWLIAGVSFLLMCGAIYAAGRFAERGNTREAEISRDSALSSEKKKSAEAHILADPAKPWDDAVDGL